MTDPVTPAEFTALMTSLGPFEPSPMVAVAVSGGADSMALALLASEWAMRLGGEAVALTVDHRLRPDSSAEAARVGVWLTARGIRHRVLAWDRPKPHSDLQAAARAARYGLLEAWCRANSVLHLLLAHHRGDQAETVLLRLGRGSGVDGLAAMAPVQEATFGRLLRPFLTLERARLRVTLATIGQDWVEDPSNRNAAFDRVRLRALMPALAAEGLTEERLAATARRMGRARSVLEQAVAEAAAGSVALDPAGWAVVRHDAFATIPDEIGLRLLSRLVLACGGNCYPPRLERVEALHAALRNGLGAARTLAGCRVVPTSGGLVFCREPARAGPPLPLVPGSEMQWDGRFRIRVPADLPAGYSIGQLGGQGWNRLVRAIRPSRLPSVPAVARPTLPVIYVEDAISAVPHVGYNRGAGLDGALRWIVPAPSNPLTVAARRLV